MMHGYMSGTGSSMVSRPKPKLCLEEGPIGRVGGGKLFQLSMEGYDSLSRHSTVPLGRGSMGTFRFSWGYEE